jgi:hypothetical protein
MHHKDDFLEYCLNNYIQDSENPHKNYELAHAYFVINQTAAASSFFIRAAERYELQQQRERAYECLLLAAQCFQMQGNRDTTVKSLLLTALNLCSKRPEAYFNICKLWRAQQKHSDCYTFANFALNNCDFSLPPLGASTGYCGKYDIVYLKAVSSWWFGKIDECTALYMSLKNEYWNEIPELQKQKVVKDIASFNLF